MVTFVDNVATLAIENCLLDPLERIFTSQIVNDMDDGKISILAAEQSHVPQERVRLTVELITLQSGIRFLNSIAIGHTSQARRPGFGEWHDCDYHIRPTRSNVLCPSPGDVYTT